MIELNTVAGAENDQQSNQSEAEQQSASDNAAIATPDEQVVAKKPGTKSRKQAAKKSGSDRRADQEKARVQAGAKLSIEDVQQWVRNAADLAASLEGAEEVRSLLNKARVALACWNHTPAARKSP